MTARKNLLLGFPGNTVSVELSKLRTLQVLYRAENRLQSGFGRVVETLDAPAQIKFLLVNNYGRPGGDRLNCLWQCASEIAAKHHVKRRNTDWVFENFWPNPREPKHSRLLAFFLDPQELHGCGLFLLEKLLLLLERVAKQSDHRNLRAKPRFIANGCVVGAESGGRIDLWIRRNAEDGKFAIIIENKINRAPDQYGYRVYLEREASQIEEYVERLHHQGYDYHEIYVFYLPLEGDRDAKPEDVKAITTLGVTYSRITFKEQITNWIELALREWQSTNNDLHEHLSYYGKLVSYLINQNKEIEMDAEILKSIEKAEKTELLTLSEFAAAISAAEALRRVFVRVLRGRLFRRIHQQLSEINLCPAFYVIREWPRLDKVRLESDYADEFDGLHHVIVAVAASAAYAVGLSWDSESGFCFAYLRTDPKGGPLDSRVQEEARRRCQVQINTQEPPLPYCAWKHETVSDEECEKEETAARLAEQIREMYEELNRVLL